jgi:hypothetical protein
MNPFVSGTAIALASPSSEQLAVLSQGSIMGMHLESGGHALAIGFMGTRGRGLSTSSRLDFGFDPQYVGGVGDERLALDLINPSFSGAVFTSIHFAVAVDGVVQLEREFSVLSDALAFFDDRRLDLAELSGASAPDRVELFFDVTTPTGFPTSLFSFQYGLLAVPEPSTPLLMLIFFAPLAYWRARLQSHESMSVRHLNSIQNLPALS